MAKEKSDISKLDSRRSIMAALWGYVTAKVEDGMSIKAAVLNFMDRVDTPHDYECLLTYYDRTKNAIQ